jgi:dolichyl-phosphate beta-glucosyltransferase
VDPLLSLIIPAYNESQRLPACLRELAEYLASRSGPVEIVLVDDGSSDGTAEVAQVHGEELGLDLRVVAHGRNLGKGRAVGSGVDAARGELMLFFDADLSYPCEAIDEATTLLASSGAEIVIGDRSLVNAPEPPRSGVLRRVAGETFAWLVSHTVLDGISDSQCGFKLFRAHVARRLFANLTVLGFGFDVEILYMAQRMGYRIARMPIVPIHREGSSVNLPLDSARMFVDLFKIRWNHLQGRYGE